MFAPDGFCTLRSAHRSKRGAQPARYLPQERAQEQIMATEQTGSSVELQNFPPQAAVSIRETGRVADLPTMIEHCIATLVNYLHHHAVPPAGPPYVRYFTFGETETDFELGIPLLEPLADEGRVSRSELAGGEA